MKPMVAMTGDDKENEDYRLNRIASTTAATVLIESSPMDLARCLTLV